jgi:hypothetical protein
LGGNSRDGRQPECEKPEKDGDPCDNRPHNPSRKILIALIDPSSWSATRELISWSATRELISWSAAREFMMFLASRGGRFPPPFFLVVRFHVERQ